VASCACHSVAPRASTASLWSSLSPQAIEATLMKGAATGVEARGSTFVPTASSNCLMNSFCPVVSSNCCRTGVAIEDLTEGMVVNAAAPASRSRPVLGLI